MVERGSYKLVLYLRHHRSAEITGSSWEQTAINADELSMAEKAQVSTEHSYLARGSHVRELSLVPMLL